MFLVIMNSNIIYASFADVIAVRRSFYTGKITLPNYWIVFRRRKKRNSGTLRDIETFDSPQFVRKIKNILYHLGYHISYQSTQYQLIFQRSGAKNFTTMPVFG